MPFFALLIDISDMAMIDNQLHNLVKGKVNSDLNGDNIVDLADMIIVDNNQLVITQGPLLGY